MASGAAPPTMKAWQYSSIASAMEKSMTLNPSAKTPTASLSKDETLVEVLSMSLNPADYKIAEMPVVGRLVVKRPASPGQDYCGRVVSTGPSSGFQPGDLVFGIISASSSQFGTLAQYTVAPAGGTALLPKGVSFDHAASIGTAALTAYQCIVPNVKAGDRVFINGGSGGTGVFGIQIAKTLGCHVTTSCSTPNVALCKSLGADEVIDYKTSDVTATLKAGGPRFDLAVDNIGEPAALYSNAHHFLKAGGGGGGGGAKFVQVGITVSLGGIGAILARWLRPAWLGGGQRPFQFLGVAPKRRDFEQLGAWMAQGKVNAVIDEVFEFEDALRALEKLRTGRARGKLVVRVDSMVGVTG